MSTGSPASHSLCSRIHALTPTRFAAGFTLCSPNFFPPSQGACLQASPLHDPVIWHGINYTGTQITQWDFQNKGKSSWTGTGSFVLEVPLRNLRPGVIYSIPCDWIVQGAYYWKFQGKTGEGGGVGVHKGLNF